MTQPNSNVVPRDGDTVLLIVCWFWKSVPYHNFRWAAICIGAGPIL